MDDEDLLLEVAEIMLQNLGYEVECVRDGARAVETYRSAMESGKPFDIVIMDLTIPGGVGGKEARRRLLEIDPQTRAIVSSGYSGDPIMAEYWKWGFAGILVKPYGTEDLGRTLAGLATAQ
jgi:CheY-like chemotaxis protein